jgi:hypothetical protein
MSSVVLGRRYSVGESRSSLVNRYSDVPTVIHVVCVMLKVKTAVYLAAMTDGRDGYGVALVIDGVNDAVVTGSNAQVRPVADELRSACRAWLHFKAVNDLSDCLTRGRIKPPERTSGVRSDLDLVAGHAPDSTSRVRS